MAASPPVQHQFSKYFSTGRSLWLVWTVVSTGISSLSTVWDPHIPLTTWCFTHQLFIDTKKTQESWANDWMVTRAYAVGFRRFLSKNKMSCPYLLLTQSYINTAIEITFDISYIELDWFYVCHFLFCLILHPED